MSIVHLQSSHPPILCEQADPLTAMQSPGLLRADLRKHMDKDSTCLPLSLQRGMLDENARY